MDDVIKILIICLFAPISTTLELMLEKIIDKEASDGER